MTELFQNEGFFFKKKLMDIGKTFYIVDTAFEVDYYELVLMQ